MVYFVLVIVYTVAVIADLRPHVKACGKAGMWAYIGLLAVSFAIFVLAELGIYLSGPLGEVILFRI